MAHTILDTTQRPNSPFPLWTSLFGIWGLDLDSDLSIIIPDKSDKTKHCFFTLFLHASHDGGLAVVGALEDAGEDAGHAGVLGLLQPPHHPLLHHADKLLVTEFAVPISIKQSEDLSLDS